MHAIDIVVIVLFAIAVVGIGLWKSRGEKETSEDYFLAGRGLTWPLIGFSLIAANISAEQMVGMSGAAANGEIGLAIASYEWMAAITLVGVAFFFLPTFLKAGIFTIPQFLEERYDGIARTVMSLLMVVVLMLVNVSVVTYLGAKFLDPFVTIREGSDITILCWIIGIAAAVYVAIGGLKACAWADLIQGSALILGGGVVTWLAIKALGHPDPAQGMNSADAVAQSLGVATDAGIAERMSSLKQEGMHMFLPKTHSVLPWTALMVGLWIPNFYYWGLNQYIVQRTLGSKSLAEGQKGVMFAALMKLIIPFVVCVPGLIAYTIYSDSMAAKADTDTNNAIVAEFESSPTGKLFLFNDDFAARNPELAEQIFQHNVQLVGGDASALRNDANGIDPEDGEQRSASEVLAAANDAAAGSKGAAELPRSGRMVGYDYDDAFPVLVSKLVPIGWKGFVIAAVMGAVVSSLASMLNAASTIFTIDIYSKFINKNATQSSQVWVGRGTVLAAVILGCIVAPFINNPALKGAFNAIQLLQGFISPGILTIFLFGLFVKRAPRICGVVGLVLSPVIYGALQGLVSVANFDPVSIQGLVFNSFLNRMAITIILISIVLLILTVIKPMTEPVVFNHGASIELTESKGAKILGVVVVVLTIGLYIYFA